MSSNILPTDSFWEIQLKTYLPDLCEDLDNHNDAFDSSPFASAHGESSPSRRKMLDDYLKASSSLIKFSMLAKADPLDRVIFSKAVLGHREVPLDFWGWTATIDWLLYDYFLLVKRKGALEAQIDIPLDIDNFYINHEKAAHSRKKNLSFQLATVTHEDRCANCKTVKYKVSALGVPSYVNLLSRALYHNASARSIHTSLFYDGLKFQLDYGETDFIPSFKLEDFIIHELYTGISLSIEVASILLEFDDPDLRKRAFRTYCEHALPTVIKSPLIYARIAASRLFLRQILSTVTALAYIPDYAADLNDDSSIYWHQLLDLAKSHIYPLTTAEGFNFIFSPDDHGIATLSEESLDTNMADVMEALSQIEYPLNLKKVLDKDNDVLAVFCQSSHRYVSSYINQLAEEASANLPVPIRTRKKEHLLFQSVHKEIRRAIEAIDRPILP